MNALDKVVLLTFSKVGTLSLSVEIVTAAVRTFFRGLDCEMNETDEVNVTDQNKEIEARVKIRMLLSTFQFCSFFSPSKYERILICIVKNKACVVFVSFTNDQGCLTYYIPLLLD